MRVRITESEMEHDSRRGEFDIKELGSVKGSFIERERQRDTERYRETQRETERRRDRDI